MEKTSPKKKIRHTFYLDPDVHAWLWNRRVETRRDVSEIGGEIFREHIERENRRKQKSQAG
jgi:hypothetical protein